MIGNLGHYARVALAHACALGVAGFFIYAAWEKLIQPRQFAIDIKNYHMLPEAYLNLAAILMPWWEMGAAAALVVPKTRRAGAMITAGLLAVFIIAIAYAALYKGLDISCGCTGKDSSQAGWTTIGRNVLLLAGTAIAFYTPKLRRSVLAFPIVAESRAV